MLLPHHGKIGFTEKNTGKLNDLVTELDFSIERFLKEALSKMYPDIGFVGEEDGGDRSLPRFWLCDPIDGTAHLIRGTPFCTSQIALIEHGEVTFAVIYDFLNDIVYHAQKNGGAFANETPIRVSDRPLARAQLGWEIKLEKPENLERYLRLEKTCWLFKAGCSGYEHLMVASGKLDGRVCFDPHGHDYDFAPGSLLVKEAGGIVANIGKRSYDYLDSNFIAANPAVFTALTEGPDAIFPL